jgi:hypothetical protein
LPLSFSAVTFAVRAQATTEEKTISFPDIDLLEVSPPTAWESYYQLPSTYTALEIADMPLFDADNQVGIGTVKRPYAFVRCRQQLGIE